MTTGERIKAARIAAGMTQSELAEKVGVKFSAIHKYETGLIVNLKRDTIGKLAKALDVKPSYLLCVDEEPETEEVELSPDEAELIEIFRSLQEQEQALILATARALKK
jgi:transcriptional regulator with XRE-family HTH domain